MKINRIEPYEFDPDCFYIDEDGKLRSFQLPCVEMTRKELEEKYFPVPTTAPEEEVKDAVAIR